MVKKPFVPRRRLDSTPDFEIIAGLCYALVRNLRSNLAKGKKISPPVSFQGGVAANYGVRKGFREIMELDEKVFIIPKHFYSMGAIGSALCTIDRLRDNPELVNGFSGLEK
ncbi:MAG: hypothetical protein JRF41_15300, partial [Deltaproteobacteria bacterium]|nr:hypothetical protein [Deltaproteobacteria bacterium]